MQVFVAGTHTDSKGKTATFRHADLDQMAANVAGAGVPVVVGHPKAADPSYAWAAPGNVKREGDRLLAKLGDINSDFEAAVDGGAYRERSLSIYKDAERGWVVEHIGFLGGAAPAIAGMQPLAYSAPPADAEQHTFAMEMCELDTGWALSSVATLLRGLREWVISKDGLDTANTVLPDYAITSVADAAARISAEAMEADTGDTPAAVASPNTLYSRTPAGNPAHNPEDNQAMPYTEADLERVRTETTAQFAAQGMELAELRAERQTERLNTQVNTWISAGLVTPAEAPGMAQFMAALESGQSVAFRFSAPDKSTPSQTPAQWFAAHVAARKAIKLGAAGRLADEPPATVDLTSTQAITRAAQQYLADEGRAGRVIDITEAIVHVTRRPAAAA